MKVNSKKSTGKDSKNKNKKLKKLTKAEAKKLMGGTCWSDGAGTVCTK